MNLPRVTDVIAAAGLGPDLSRARPEDVAAGRARGSAVHAACEGLVYGYLDEATLSPEVAPYVSAFRKFLAESRFEPIRAEYRVEHPVWRYCGHPDLLGFLTGLRTIVDVKTGDDTGAKYQVSAYCDAHTAQYPDEPVLHGAILHLRDDGTFRLDPVSLVAALPVFRAALVVFNARKELGR